jgi:YHS domain-containing protein
MRTILTSLGLASLLLLVVVGCSRVPSEGPPEAKPQPAGKTDEHGHKQGDHGGLIVPIGGDNYHAEAVFDKDGTLRLYTLGRDEGKIQEVVMQTLEAFVKPDGVESTKMNLEAVPRKGDAAGKTSQFVGILPKQLQGKHVTVTVPSITIGGERFRLSFATTSGGHEEPMPVGRKKEEEKKLYLTPGGAYTAADIEANGNRTAAEKYPSFMGNHNAKPKLGDKICPVSKTKANPKCTWIVAGKTYQFCCPPCINEFVDDAKKAPEKLLKPDDYVKTPETE